MTDFLVTDRNDASGSAATLLAAIEGARATPGPDTIRFAPRSSASRSARPT
jgi:hypothetical protein